MRSVYVQTHQFLKLDQKRGPTCPCGLCNLNTSTGFVKKVSCFFDGQKTTSRICCPLPCLSIPGFSQNRRGRRSETQQTRARPTSPQAHICMCLDCSIYQGITHTASLPAKSWCSVLCAQAAFTVYENPLKAIGKHQAAIISFQASTA